MTSSPARNRRADARRSRAAILDAAVRVLNARPDAGMGAVATAAGVTRQTVYAHFPTRERLLSGVLDHLTAATVAEMDAADLDTGPAAEALLRLLDAGARTAGRHPVLMRALAALPADPDGDAERHTEVADRLRRVVRRGRRTGEFDDRLPVDWLVAVIITLSHTASEERDAGRLSAAEADEALRTTLLRLLGADGS
ncbi:TetR/AcrR family transcriptional regulator [Actinomadura algeriensis]|uniref:AcrR family transcriptional regulator n=1 Tax=Actinomadura algeriensis TaxID=1679523 RepID=A0ABR9JJS7_9ACTN|nr:TetR/AcrR family transcriptional regulator [Actinomadura algeriensis]MBE1530797.1 AcrR family transcriptional regulator [Actinomadura algeriensis]